MDDACRGSRLPAACADLCRTPGSLLEIGTVVLRPARPAPVFSHRPKFGAYDLTAFSRKLDFRSKERWRQCTGSADTARRLYEQRTIRRQGHHIRFVGRQCLLHYAAFTISLSG